MVSLPQAPLRTRILRSGFWSVTGHFATQGIRLGGNLITTRLLMPDMFGVMAIANVLIIGIEMFSDIGLRQNIVQSTRGKDATFLNTAWSVQIIRGCVLSVIILIVSLLFFALSQFDLFPPHSVYANDLLPYVIATLSIAPVISGFESTNVASASRGLTLNRIVTIEILTQLLGLLTVILWCYFQRSVWALVAGWIAASLSKTILSHTVLPGIRNEWTFDKESLVDIYHFGKWIFLSSILGFLLNQGDRIILGALLGANELGIYSIAVLLIGAIEGILRKLMGSVSYPALSEIFRNDRSRFASAYYRFRAPIDIISLFLAGALFTSGDAVIDFLYDNRYHDAGWMVETLAISLFFLRYDVAGFCCLVLDKPKLLSAIIAIRVISLYSLTPIAFALYGLQGAVYIIATTYLVALPLTIKFKLNNGIFSLPREAYTLPAVIAGIFSGKALSFVLTEFR